MSALCAVFCLSAFAEDKNAKAKDAIDSYSDIYGTVEKGITFAEGYGINDIAPLPGFMNGDFSAGLKFWGGLNNKQPTDIVSIETAGENKYLSFKQVSAGDGVFTLRFACNKLIPGKPAVLVYDWSGPLNFYVSLEQRDSNTVTLLSSGLGKSLYEAKSENEWNTGVTEPIHPVRIPIDGYYQLFFSVKIEIVEPEENIKIDNIRLAYTNENNVIYDLDGNEIKGEVRTEDEAEEPTDVYAENDTSVSETKNTQGNDAAFDSGGDNEELIKTFTVIGALALGTILAVVPSLIVKAARAKNDNDKKNFSDMLKEMDRGDDSYRNESKDS